MAHTIILQDDEIIKKIRRIAFQIYESHYSEEEIVIIGIEKNGYILATKIIEELKNISQLKIEQGKITIDKKNVFKPAITSIEKQNYQNKCIVIIDDVLHTGKTLMYVIKHFLDVQVKQIKTVVLVDRNHKKYPVKVDFKGLSLSTSLKSNVIVKFENNKWQAFLE